MASFVDMIHDLFKTLDNERKKRETFDNDALPLLEIAFFWLFSDSLRWLFADHFFFVCFVESFHSLRDGVAYVPALELLFF